MAVRLTPESVIELVGLCPIEDAEPLLSHLLSIESPVVDWRMCEQAHTAVVQVLLASKATLRGTPAGAFLREYVAPLMAGEPMNAAI
jgi:hypothetical protein